MTLPDYLPKLGETVIYRTDGRNGLSYDLPAIITCLQRSHPGDYPDGSPNPLPVPEDEWHVHLTVFSPGGYGSFVPKSDDRPHHYGQIRAHDDDAFIGAKTFVPGSGSYVEWNVPFWKETDTPTSVGHRTWRRH